MDAWEKDEDGNYILDAFGEKIPTPTGFSYNEFGFYRTYNLKDIDNSPSIIFCFCPCITYIDTYKILCMTFHSNRFYRTYNLKDIDNSPAAQQRRSNGIYTNEEGKIRRPAGNYPIQCFAAELFRIILIRFYNRSMHP